MKASQPSCVCGNLTFCLLFIGFAIWLTTAEKPTCNKEAHEKIGDFSSSVIYLHGEVAWCMCKQMMCLPIFQLHTKRIHTHRYSLL